MGFAQTALTANDPYLLGPRLWRRYGVGMGIQLLVVAAGGAIGSSLRYLITLGSARVFGTGLPLGTLAVNLLGCLLAGIVFGMAEERAAFPPIVRVLLLTGFLGGFTTFSTFGVETVTLVRDGSWMLALSSFAANGLAGVLLAAAGIYVGRVA
jgi:CrcB protein